MRFNQPYISGKELGYLEDVIQRKHLAGKGHYTQLCQKFMNENFGFQHTLFTPSCSDALEICAILSGVKEGDEVIVPSYTFVSSANAFALRGAHIRFADSMNEHPNAGVKEIESLINEKTKVVVAVHYGGHATQIREIREVCDKNNLLLVEDAACGLGSYAGEQPLGSFGDFTTFSFHETKNVTCGKGGLLVVNNENFFDRAQIVWEKGTNRSAFFKGEVDKYGWVDLGSSYLNSEIMASFLYAQLEDLSLVNDHRKNLWDTYYAELSPLGLNLNQLGSSAYNYHMFYVLADDEVQRDYWISELKKRAIQAVFHYQALHNSQFALKNFPGQSCENALKFESTLMRLPIHMDLSIEEVLQICKEFKDIVNNAK
ncbi:dTDP-4-amino-4,6-dideoxygalactose transaminase [bacterium]|nr:dTDP-4-amino-4,6-dideoxygalactose transaminase [bacterium]